VKRLAVLSVLCALAVLTSSTMVLADMAPSQWVVIPEAIWAAASGGGTWVTNLQIIASVSGTNVSIEFFYQNGGDFRTVFLFTSVATRETVRYNNILQHMGTIDTAFSYYGRVGTLLISGQDASHPLWAQALTANGNYGKTYPSFVWKATANTADVGRQMIIMGIMKDTTFRTGTGFWNSTSGTMDVTFYVMAWQNSAYGSFTKTFNAYGFLSFNPFTEAGLGASTITNSWLWIWPTAKTGSGEGLFCFGSLANNITNDTYALIAQPFQ
jgi:hypothetical protein